MAHNYCISIYLRPKQAGQMNKFTKITLLTGLILILYGYLCRAIGLYFFWESKYYGWSIIFVGIIAFLSTRIKLKRAQARKTILEKIGVGLLIFILLIQAILIIVIPSTDAYKVTKEFLLANESLKIEIGNIKSFNILPIGSIQKNTTNDRVSGNARIHLIVKGEKKFKDVTAYVEKTTDTGWTVTRLE